MNNTQVLGHMAVALLQLSGRPPPCLLGRTGRLRVKAVHTVQNSKINSENILCIFFLVTRKTAAFGGVSLALREWEVSNV